MIRINIAEQFSRTPGARYRSDGPHSGEEFREKFLVPLFANEDDNSKIEIVLDGAAGYATSFLDEAFGGIARLYGVKRCLERLAFISNEEPLLIEEIRTYIEEAGK